MSRGTLPGIDLIDFLLLHILQDLKGIRLFSLPMIQFAVSRETFPCIQEKPSALLRIFLFQIIFRPLGNMVLYQKLQDIYVYTLQ